MTEKSTQAQPTTKPAAVKPPSTPTKPTPSIVEIAAQFEVAEKRLAAIEAEYDAAVEELSRLRALISERIKD